MARGEARFGTYNIYLGKLHGSLSWRQLGDGTVVEVPAFAQWPQLQKFISAAPDVSNPSLLIFPGAAKFIQTTGFVYGEMMRRLTEFLSRPNSCFIINGYGFADDHINRVILSALQNPTLQVIIYLPELNEFGIFPNLPPTAQIQVPNVLLGRLIKRELPQVTVCGYGARAYFNSMANDLPEPALLDDPAQRARELVRLIGTAPGQVATTESAAPAPPPAEGGNSGAK